MFGGQKGTALTGSVNSVTNPTVASGSVAVIVGDLIYAYMAQQTGLTVTAVTDNLGNTYTAVTAGTDAGTISGRAFYSRVTAAGTLTTVNFAATASANDASVIAVVIEGPFAVGPIDANPADTSDATTPFDCPPTGTLTQALQVVMAAMATAANETLVVTAPSVIAGAVSRANASSAISRRLVNATTTVTPQFTGTSAVATQTTASFRALVGTERLLTDYPFPRGRSGWKRLDYSWVQATNIALLTSAVAFVDEFMPARALGWPDTLHPPRRDYDLVQPTNIALFTTIAIAEKPAGQSTFVYDFRALRRDYGWAQSSSIALLTPAAFVDEFMPARATGWPDTLHPSRRDYDLVQSTNIALFTTVVGKPVGQSIQRRIITPEFPRSLRSWERRQDTITVFQPGAPSSAIDIRPPRGSYDWVQPTNIALLSAVVVEALPAGKSAQSLIRWPEYLRGLRTWTQVQAPLEEQLPVGDAVSRRVPDPEYLRTLRSRIAAKLFEELLPPLRQNDWPKVQRYRSNYNWVQATNIALLTEVAEAMPAGKAVQNLVRWLDYPKGLRSWTKVQALEEQAPVGRAVSQRLLDPEYLRTLRSRSTAKLFEELMPPRPGEWPKIIRYRSDYDWIQATNIALLTEVAETPPPRPGQLPKVLRYRDDVSWVQATNIALLTAEAELPAGGSVLRRLPDPEYLRTLRSRSAVKLFEEQLPIGQDATLLAQRPPYPKSLRTWISSTIELLYPPPIPFQRQILWPLIPREPRGNYSYTRGINIPQQTEVFEEPPLRQQDWPKITREPYPRSLRTWTQVIDALSLIPIPPPRTTTSAYRQAEPSTRHNLPDDSRSNVSRHSRRATPSTRRPPNTNES